MKRQTGIVKAVTPEYSEKTIHIKESLMAEKKVSFAKFILNGIRENTMPIGGWVAPTPQAQGRADFISRKYYAYAAEAGLNILYGLYERYPENKFAVESALNLSEQAGIKYIVNDSFLHDEKAGLKHAAETQSIFLKYKSFGGFLLWDEPGRRSFHYLKKAQTILSQKYGPNNLYLINMLPDYANSSHLVNGMWTPEGTADYTYERYLYDYFKIVRPPVFSYDYYPFRGGFPNISKTYFKNLSFARKLCTLYDTPLWVFIEAIGRKDKYRLPTKSELQWQVNTSLIYGAKGLQYFCYFTPLDDQKFGFSNAMISGEGEKTELYHMVKEMNSFIKSLSPYYMDAGFYGIMYSGSSPLELPAEDIISDFPGISKIEGSSTLAGCFKYADGSKAVLLMNNAICGEKQVVKLTFCKTLDFTAISGKGTQKITSDTVSVELESGESIFIKYDMGE